jgi:hypothetical protein
MLFEDNALHKSNFDLEMVVVLYRMPGWISALKWSCKVCKVKWICAIVISVLFHSFAYATDVNPLPFLLMGWSTADESVVIKDKAGVHLIKNGSYVLDYQVKLIAVTNDYIAFSIDRLTGRVVRASLNSRGDLYYRNFSILPD